MSAQHTPGPWCADDGGGHYFGVFAEANGEGICYLVEPGTPLVERKYILPREDIRDYIDAESHQRWSEHIANARLIAAAPELLAALCAMVHRLEHHGSIGIDNHCLRQEFDACVAAIVKATQEDPSS